MKKRLTVITLFLMLCTTMFGQNTPEYPESWGDIITGYDDSKLIIGKASILGEVIDDRTNFVIGAFCDGELRSVSTLDEYYEYYLDLPGTRTDWFSFAIYDQETEEVLYSDYSVQFRYVEDMDFIDINFSYHWNYGSLVSGDFEGRMKFTSAHIIIDGKDPDVNSNLEIAPFCNGEIRTDQVVILGGNKVSFYVFGNDKDIISFKLYDHVNKVVYDSELTYEFQDQLTYLNEDINFIGNSSFMVDGNYYNVLQNAINAAEGKTVTFIRDAEGAGVVIDKNVTIDFAGHTYTVNAAANAQRSADAAFQINKVFNNGVANQVVLKDGTIKVAEGCEIFNTLVKNYADLTTEDMTFVGDNLDLGESSHVISFVSGVAHAKRSTITANEVEGETHYSFVTLTEEGYSNPVVNLYLNDDYNTITGLAEYLGGSVIGNTEAGLEVVAKKSFDAVSGEIGSREGWGTISTPVYTEGTNGIAIPVSAEPGSPFANHDLYRYHEPTATWKYYNNDIENQFSTFDLGQGYLYANKQDITLELQGKLAYGKKDVTFTISYTEEVGAQAGFNFIGNPFLCQISSAQIQSETHDLADGFYVVSTEGALVPNDPSYPYVKPMESVMIQLTPKSTIPSAKIGSFKTKVTIHPTPIVKERTSEVNGSLAINVSNENYNDVAYVSFSENIGLNKVAHYNEEIPMVSVSVDGADYAIAMMSQDVTEIPVSFKAAQMGEYTIGVEARDCEYSTMTLVDRLSGIETNLLLEDYTFMAKSGDNSDRFVIRLAKDNGSNNGSENFAYINNGMMFINNIAGQAVINVYDVTGRPVAEYNVAESASISTSDFAAGMYIIRMSDENGVKVQKIIVE